MKDKARLWAELQEAVNDYRHNLKRIGSLIIQLVDNGEPLTLVLGRLRNLGVPVAASTVGMRWASGDYGDDEQVYSLIEKVPFTWLQKWTNKTVHEVLTNRHTIVSPIEGRVVTKRWEQLTRQEISKNAYSQGLMPVNQDIPRIPRYRYCKMTDVIVDEQGRTLIVAKHRNDTFYLHVDEKTFRKLEEKLKTPA